MTTDLWSFALKTYARPGVEEACLRLQSDGANVCLLLCAAWLGQRGVAWESQRTQALRELAQPWHDEVVEPLRRLRTQWRDSAQTDQALRVLREQVKSLELEAERQLLLRLEGVSQSWPQGAAEDLPIWLQACASQTGRAHHDALQRLRVAITDA